MVTLFISVPSGDQTLVGLVRNTAPGIRPSLLGQTHFRSFGIGFSAVAPTLKLSTGAPAGSLVGGGDWAPMVDLREKGAPSQQYVVRLTNVLINGQSLTSLLPSGEPAPLYG